MAHKTEFFTYANKKIEYVYLPYSQNKFLNLLSPKTTIIYLNGFTDCFQNHYLILELLKERGFDVYSLNFPGLGESEELEVSWNVLVEIVETLIELRKLQNIVLIGHSMGGGVVLKLAEKHYTKILSVGVIDPACYSMGLVDAKRALISIVKLFQDVRERKQQSFNKFKPFPMASDREFAILGYIEILADYSLDLSNYRNPIRVMLSENDEIIDNVKVEETLGVYDNVEINVLPNVGHMKYFLTLSQHQQLVKFLLGK